MIAAPKKVLLLDVDGVVFNHRGLLRKVGNKVVNYVARQLNVEQYEAEGINHLLYSQFGHTYIGLKRIYNIDNTIDDFSAFVYNDEMLDKLHSTPLNGELLKNSTEVRLIANMCKMNDIDMYMFSNAPYVWCRTVVDVLMLQDLFSYDQILCCDHDVFQGSLKPQKRVYDTVANVISHKHRDDDIQLIYVDDSFTNLLPVLGDSRWRPIYFNKDGVNINSKTITTIDNMLQLQDSI